MAKAKIVLALLATAQILAETNKDERLIDVIAKLEALEDATHSTTEYKNLKLIVDELENNAGDDKSNNNDDKKQIDDLPQKNDGENTGDENNAGDDKFDAIVEEKPKKINYTGIKMIGNKWYSIKDKYKQSFATADECALHFN